MTFRVDDELKSLIPPMTQDERSQMLANVMRDGVLSPFIVWEEENVLVEGHHRYDICLENGIDFPRPIARSFPNRDAVREWMIRHQFGRRNLHPFQRVELALKLEPLLKSKAREKQREGGRKKVPQKSAEPIESRDELAAIAGVSHDTIAKGKRIAQEAPEEVKEKLRRGEQSINEAHKSIKKKANVQEIIETAKTETVEDIASLVESGEKFSCIYADPPWQYSNQATRASTDNHYTTMPIEDICKLPVSQVVADKALLFLWTTNGFLFDSQKVIESWGFEFKSSIIWVKPQIGIGNYVRNSHEFLLIASRGGMRTADAGKRQKSWVEADRLDHSRKPGIFREIVENLSTGRRLELFGRERIKGWTVWGNQISKQGTLEYSSAGE